MHNLKERIVIFPVVLVQIYEQMRFGLDCTQMLSLRQCSTLFLEILCIAMLS